MSGRFLGRVFTRVIRPGEMLWYRGKDPVPVPPEPEPEARSADQENVLESKDLRNGE